jgi:site-specific DNA recombinase
LSDLFVGRSQTPAFLTGLLYDDRGHRMSPSHANKKGVRYRYYVSQALLQNRKDEAGSISRVAAPEVEEFVAAAVRHHVGHANSRDIQDRSLLGDLSDRDLVALHVERIALRSRQIEIRLRASAPDAQHEGVDACEDDAQHPPTPTEPITLRLPWTPASAFARKGIAWKPSAKANLDPETIETLLTAIAKARSWMNDLAEGRVESFDDIALREDRVERHVRFLAPLAFVSPRIIDAIASGAAPADLTVSALARALPHGWAEQERKLGIA